MSKPSNMEFPTRTISDPAKPLKRKKSLTRLLSAALPKSSRSRPSSPASETPFTPPTPRLPTHLLSRTPTIPNTLAPSPSLAQFDFMFGEGGNLAKGGAQDAIGLGISKKEQQLNAQQEKMVLGQQFSTARPLRARAESHGQLNQSNDSLSTQTKLQGLQDTTHSRIELPQSPATPERIAKIRPSPSMPSLRRPIPRSVVSPSPPRIPFDPLHPITPKVSEDQQPLGLEAPPSPCSPGEVRQSYRSATTTGSSPSNATATEQSSILTKDTTLTDVGIDSQSRPTSKASVKAEAEAAMTVDEAIDMYVAGFADDADAEEPSRSVLTVSPVEEDTAPHSVSAVSPIDEDTQQSEKLAEAMAASIVNSPVSPVSPFRASGYSLTKPVPFSPQLTSPAPVSPELSTAVPEPFTPGSPYSATRDQYGFLKANNHVSREAYDTWVAQYIPLQARRSQKWAEYMQMEGLSSMTPTKFPSRGAKTQRYVRKGIPPAWRGDAWFFYSGAQEHLDRNPFLYARLVDQCERDLPENEIESIERDLHRTFPDNVYFRPNENLLSTQQPETPLLVSLRRLLRAFALYQPQIGYCQSLNFIAGMLLLFLPEEKAFWMVHVITTQYLPGTHELSLEGANIDLWVLMLALNTSLPGVWAKIGGNASSPVPTSDSKSTHSSKPSVDARSIASTAQPSDEASQRADMRRKDSKKLSRKLRYPYHSKNLSTSSAAIPTRKSKLPPVSLCTTSWFMSLFIGTLPIETTLRVWDILFYEGPQTIFRAALAIFKLLGRDLYSKQQHGKHHAATDTEIDDALAGSDLSIELFQLLQSLPRSMLDASNFVDLLIGSNLSNASRKAVNAGASGNDEKAGPTNEWVQVKREERRAWYADERLRAVGAAALQSISLDTSVSPAAVPLPASAVTPSTQSILSPADTTTSSPNTISPTTPMSALLNTPPPTLSAGLRPELKRKSSFWRKKKEKAALREHLMAQGMLEREREGEGAGDGSRVGSFME